MQENASWDRLYAAIEEIFVLLRYRGFAFRHLITSGAVPTVVYKAATR